MRELIEREIGSDILLPDEAVRAYAVHTRLPKVVVAPRTTVEAVAVLQLASRQGLAVECAGAGTRLSGGNPPRALDIVMSSSRMNALAEYEPADLVVTVQAGVSFPQLERAVSANNQFLALDPPGSAEATIGAAVSTSATGPLRFAHGTPRDQVLGIEIVTGDGRVLHFGGRVVKNVAGYDAVRLLVGSYGTLGFITQISLRLKPTPVVDNTLLIRGSSLADLSAIVQTVLDAHVESVALELLSPELAAAVTGNAQWTLMVRMHGNAGSVSDTTKRITALAAAGSVEPSNGAGWHALGQTEGTAKVRLRFGNLPSQLQATAAQARRAAELAGLENTRVAIHAGDGIVRVLADAAPPQAAQVLENERNIIEAAGGSLIVDRLPGVEMDAFGRPAAVGLMAQIKKAFDPIGVLGPGRFVV